MSDFTEYQVDFGIQCEDERGIARNVDERWTHMDGCNTCSCLSTGVPRCTRLACENITEPSGEFGLLL